MINAKVRLTENYSTRVGHFSALENYLQPLDKWASTFHYLADIFVVLKNSIGASQVKLLESHALTKKSFILVKDHIIGACEGGVSLWKGLWGGKGVKKWIHALIRPSVAHFISFPGRVFFLFSKIWDLITFWKLVSLTHSLLFSGFIAWQLTLFN